MVSMRVLPVTAIPLVLGLLLPSHHGQTSGNIGFALVSNEFSFFGGSSSGSSISNSHKNFDLIKIRNTNYRKPTPHKRTMATIFMSATASGLDSRVKDFAAADGKVQAVVPFGGSAPGVKNPVKQILGGKGLGLQEMSSIGINVPPGFTLTTPLCSVYQESNDLPPHIWDEVKIAIDRLEKDMGKQFGRAENPLLLSCRSGAAVSMPGMMDTVLNV